MKVDNNTTIKVNPKKIKSNNNSNVDFSAILDNFSSDDGAGEVNNVTNIDNITPMLSIQELNQDTAETKNLAYDHAEDMLNLLESIKNNIINGVLSLEQLQNIENNLKNKNRPEIFDPKLNNILDEIELRVAVEIAKIEKLL